MISLTRCREAATLDAALLLAALVLALALKQLYSDATVEDLRWVLKPTAIAVEALSGSPFIEERGAGYLSRELHFIITPACAGVNFLIAAICTAVYTFTPTRPASASKIGLFVVGVVAAYLTTLIANTVRILIGIQVHLHSISLGRLSAEQIHRVEGVAVYFLFLCAMYFVGHAWLSGSSHALPQR
jgi:exosortase K